MHSLEQLHRGELAGITRLDLACDLTEFPEAIFSLADSLEVLNLSGNQLSRLPDDLPRLHKLRVLFCSDNTFTEVPAVLGQCAQLEMVGFKANQIRHLPAAALPAKLTVPMILFFLPVLFIVILGPAILNIMDTMAKG